MNLGGGSAYTSINFKEQGTHFLFILHAGLGYKWNDFFGENRFKHYSNGSTATPNRSINANIIMVGMYF
ncbi:MAG: acyloxyacyl hydrolase [Syntrophorhabdus sp.]